MSKSIDETGVRALLILRMDGMSANQFARVHGISQTDVSAFLAERKGPGPSILSVLGLRRIVRYVQSDEPTPLGIHACAKGR